MESFRPLDFLVKVTPEDSFCRRDGFGPHARKVGSPRFRFLQYPFFGSDAIGQTELQTAFCRQSLTVSCYFECALVTESPRDLPADPNTRSLRHIGESHVHA